MDPDQIAFSLSRKFGSTMFSKKKSRFSRTMVKFGYLNFSGVD